jgi:methyl-accepting chemotaxis protein
MFLMGLQNLSVLHRWLLADWSDLASGGSMRWTIGKKLAISFSLVLLIFLLSTIFSYLKLEQLGQIEDDLFANRLPALEVTYDLRTANNRANAALARCLLLRPHNVSATEGAKAELAEAVARTEKDVAVLRELSTKFISARNQELVTEAAAAVARYKGIQQEIIRAAEAGSLDHSLAQLGENGNDATVAVRNVAAELAAGVHDVIKQRSELIHKTKNRTQQVLIFSTLASIFMGLCIAFVISRKVARALAAVVEQAEAIAAGDLGGQDLLTASQDEIAKLMAAMNRMQVNLRTIVRSIEEKAEAVASASEEISASSTRAADGAGAQSDQTTQVATAIQEVSATVLEVSQNSSRAADSARKTAEVATQGGKIVNEALASMQSIAAAVGTTAKKVEELGKSSDQIGKIVGVIDDIADQTNLLALNAAIEAARAGEQGRGFAVVADEVRKLAERTTKATKEIAEMIGDTQAETKTAVAQMHAGTKQVEIGVAATMKAGTSLEEIIAAAQHVGDMISQIATASTQQAATAEQITSNVEQIAKITQESAAGAKQSAKACEELSGLALDLQQLVGKFKVDGGGSSSQSNLGASLRGAKPAHSYPSPGPAGKGNGHGMLGHGILKDTGYDANGFVQ